MTLDFSSGVSVTLVPLKLSPHGGSYYMALATPALESESGKQCYLPSHDLIMHTLYRRRDLFVQALFLLCVEHAERVARLPSPFKAILINHRLWGMPMQIE